MTIQEFIAKTGVVMTYRPSFHNPHTDSSDKMNNYEVKLTSGDYSACLFFSKGKGLLRDKQTQRLYRVKMSAVYDQERTEPEPPTLAEVLDCMASDALCLGMTFEEWADEFGYDADSRKAEQTFNRCVEQSKSLRLLLGRSAFDELVNHVERM